MTPPLPGDDALEAALKALTVEERALQARFLRLLAEFDVRGLPLLAGFPNLYEYCRGELGYAEGGSYERVQSARAGLRFPAALERIRDGRLSMAALAVLAPLLDELNWEDLLAEAEGKGRREAEALVAELFPREDGPDEVSVAGGGGATASDGGGAPPPDAPLDRDAAAAAHAERRAAREARDRVEALSAERVRFGFTGSAALRGKLERARQLLWHKDPSGRLEAVLGALADFYLDRQDPDRRLGLASRRPEGSAAGRDGPGQAAHAGAAHAPGRHASARSRLIPQAVKDEVWARDGGRCAYVSPDGRRCEARAGLEYDHIVPWVLGGRSDSAVNVRLMCRGHNQWRARERVRPTPDGGEDDG